MKSIPRISWQGINFQFVFLKKLSQPLSSKANLPVQIVIDPRTKVPSLRRNFSDGRIYYDQDLPKLPGDVIQKACGETVTYRMLDGKVSL